MGGKKRGDVLRRVADNAPDLNVPQGTLLPSLPQGARANPQRLRCFRFGQESGRVHAIAIEARRAETGTWLGA